MVGDRQILHLEWRDHSIFLAVKGTVKPKKSVRFAAGHDFVEIDQPNLSLYSFIECIIAFLALSAPSQPVTSVFFPSSCL